MPPMAKPSALKQTMHRVRSEAVISAVNRLLASKGYEYMTVDEVASEAGLAKASLYKLFTSKEELAAAAMVRVLDQALAVAQAMRQSNGPLQARQALDALKAVARWAMLTQLQGDMPSLPAQNSALNTALMGHEDYTDRLIELSNQLGIWITQAQTGGLLNAQLPPELLLYNLFACACHPVLGLMKDSGQYSDEQIVQWMISSVFDGLQAQAA
jgi:TetR/AcrR family transcriptional regulator of autoinduction and epiphytic fitness